MAKYKLIHDSGDGDKVIHTFNEENLDVLLLRIRYFLSGCSWVINPLQEELVILDRSVVEDSPKRGKKRLKK